MRPNRLFVYLPVLILALAVTAATIGAPAPAVVGDWPQ